MVHPQNILCIQIIKNGLKVINQSLLNNYNKFSFFED